MSNQIAKFTQAGDCADTNCIKMSSAHSFRASSLVAIVPLLLSFTFFNAF
jgi:hypothetical protein